MESNLRKDRWHWSEEDDALLENLLLVTEGDTCDQRSN
jgi:hypothetical protein